MTPAVTLLERSDITHRVLTYEHDPAVTSYGDEAADALGIDPNAVYKTLVATVDDRPVIAVVPVSARLDLKALARSAGGKKAALADEGDAERMTGYVLGGISPLGQRKKLATFVDSSAEQAAVMYVSGGRRGMEIELRPADLVALTGGEFFPIATD